MICPDCFDMGVVAVRRRGRERLAPCVKCATGEAKFEALLEIGRGASIIKMIVDDPA